MLYVWSIEYRNDSSWNNILLNKYIYIEEDQPLPNQISHSQMLHLINQIDFTNFNSLIFVKSSKYINLYVKIDSWYCWERKNTSLKGLCILYFYAAPHNQYKSQLRSRLEERRPS